MPRKLTAYGCKFKCGQRVSTKKADIEKHENQYCIKNPDRRACPTCKHNELDMEFGYFCNADHLEENRTLTWGCRFHQVKI